MNLLTNILNSKSYWTKCSSALCGVAVAEMGVRTIAFVCYSIGTNTSKNTAYWSSKLVSFPFEKTWESLKFLGKHLDIVNHPTWVGVAALITIIGLYNLGKNIFEQPTKVPTPLAPIQTIPPVDIEKFA